jgi:penicillin-binding protein 2D
MTLAVRLALPAAVAVSPAMGQAGGGASDEPWRIVDPPQSTLVYANDGTLVGEIGREIRTSVPLASLPTYLPQAFIAIEDHRFYEHTGVDVVGVISALKDRVLRGRERGASTITQQLVGNMHPDIVSRRDLSLGRKLREQRAAREMERHYSKAQILEAYLNQINFGHGWYGVDAAARHYFGKPAGRVSLAEAALLAALPKGPAEFDPSRFPLRARRRRDLVLTLMARQGLITEQAAAQAKREPLSTIPFSASDPAPYFVDAVRSAAVAVGVATDSGQGGYRIYSTLDLALQRAATAALLDGTAALESRPGYTHPTLSAHARGSAGSSSSTPYLQGVAIAIDPASGEVRALVGGRDYRDSPFDRAINAVRHPGSAFKPIVYAAAIADNIPANSIAADTALAIPLDDGTIYRPTNADGQFLGAMTLRQAFVWSRNPVAIELAERVGIDSVIALARRLGIASPIAPYPSSAIGASGVRPIELVEAYGALATLGTVHEPALMTRIEDRAGRTVWATDASVAMQHPVLDSGAAFIVRDMMRDVIERGTASAVRRTLSPSVLAAGKTGTTNDDTDVWFIGMTPDLVAGVWLGFDDPQSITPGAAGGTLAAPIWARMMETYYAGGPAPAGDWVPPTSLVSAQLDRLTGALADSTTPPDQRYTEYFLPGTEPGAFDPRSVFDAGPIIVQ